jgi:hypothetical protein
MGCSQSVGWVALAKPITFAATEAMGFPALYPSYALQKAPSPDIRHDRMHDPAVGELGDLLQAHLAMRP